ncbi:S8 family peptidase [Catelliglobosispora koreensis]|uniref:S8 family peptidase n=1 Tax=Catelliglobosispora koreensis TaxID=129052 RepID=UPI000363F99E|nr:S8 family serine peptidase [Catelliglobosispora koreensis]
MRTKLLSGLLGLALAFGTAPVSGASPKDIARPAQGNSKARTLTLITGDEVTVVDGQHVSVHPGPGRKDITFTTLNDGKRTRVIPGDAAKLLASGRLDPRLFDVTALLEFGYDRRDYLPLIVSGGPSTAGLAHQRQLRSLKATAVHQDRATAAQSWRQLSSASRIWLDGMRKAGPAQAKPAPGKGVSPSRAQLAGDGVTVAILDSGIDDTHPDLAGRVVARQNFTEPGYEDERDLSGHGTHVAATAAAAAPGAKLLDGKVCVVVSLTDFPTFCGESWIVAAMEWAVGEQHAKIVNMSFGRPDHAETDPIEEAVQRLSDQYGALFVAAAGNEKTIFTPGSADAALTVGATDSTGAVAPFSGRGPRLGDAAVKPDLTAPGVDVTAARGKDAMTVPGYYGDLYTTLSGTSMAASQVSGAAAVLAQLHPDWTGSQLKAALMASARPNPVNGVFEQGAGGLDLHRAIVQSITTHPASVSFGRQAFPHTDDEVLSKELTYANHGTQPVVLHLAIAGPELFSLSAATVSVPAGGTTSVTLRAATTAASPTGAIGGWVVATAGETVVRTAFGLDNEVESYDVTVKHIDRASGVPSWFATRLSRHGAWSLPDTGIDSGVDTTVFRVRRGAYTLDSFISSENGSTLMAQPRLDVDHDMTIVVDARQAQPIKITVPRPDAQAQMADASAILMHDEGWTTGHLVGSNSPDQLFTGRIGPEQTEPKFLSRVGAQFTAAGNMDSPYAYLLNFPIRGQMANGFQRDVADKDLAQVHSVYAAIGANTMGDKRAFPSISDFGAGGFYASTFMRLPFKRTEFYNTDPGVEWLGVFDTFGENESRTSTWDPAYKTYSGRSGEAWNSGVFGSAFPQAVMLEAPTRRIGNVMEINLSDFSDGHRRWGAASGTVPTVLSRDGKKLLVSDYPVWLQAYVPPSPGTYQLETQATHQSELSTTVSAAWTFRSGHADNETMLPLWGVTLQPKLDAHNSLAGGQVHRVAVTAAAQAGSKPGKLTTLCVEVSFDDGAHWIRVPVILGAAYIPHPSGSGFASLRAKVADNAGNAFEETIIRAYRIR